MSCTRLNLDYEGQRSTRTNCMKKSIKKIKRKRKRNRLLPLPGKGDYGDPEIQAQKFILMYKYPQP